MAWLEITIDTISSGIEDVASALTAGGFADLLLEDQTEFEVRYNGYVERYEKASSRIIELQTLRKEKERAANNIGDFMFDINELSEPIQQFDEGLWLALVERVLVHSNGRLTFRFTGGFETTI